MLEKEKALLVALDQSKETNFENYLKEIEFLAKTAGIEICSTIIQKRIFPTANYFLGKGKIFELKEIIEKENIDFLLFANELSPRQQQNIEKIVEIKTIDRIQLILDIFAKHARSKEGKLQVELAQLNYLLPRLKGQGINLSRLGGGIGTRGPGEQKLETDRRKIRKKIEKIKDEIEKIKKNRLLHYEARKEKISFNISLVGYTNAGKSTVLGKLTDTNIKAENMLFTTLDPLNRKVVLPDKKEVIISDTVGFIKKLPPYLISAFRATLEEIANANLLICVIDLSHPEWEKQKQVVYEILKELKVDDKPILHVFNKIDLIENKEILEKIKNEDKEAIFISALHKNGLDILLQKIQIFLEKDYEKFEIVIPYNKAKILNSIHTFGIIDKEEYKNNGIYFQGWMNKKNYGQIIKQIKNIGE